MTGASKGRDQGNINDPEQHCIQYTFRSAAAKWPHDLDILRSSMQHWRINGSVKGSYAMDAHCNMYTSDNQTI